MKTLFAIHVNNDIRILRVDVVFAGQRDNSGLHGDRTGGRMRHTDGRHGYLKHGRHLPHYMLSWVKPGVL